MLLAVCFSGQLRARSHLQRLTFTAVPTNLAPAWRPVHQYIPTTRDRRPHRMVGGVMGVLAMLHRRLASPLLLPNRRLARLPLQFVQFRA